MEKGKSEQENYEKGQCWTVRLWNMTQLQRENLKKDKYEKIQSWVGNVWKNGNSEKETLENWQFRSGKDDQGQSWQEQIRKQTNQKSTDLTNDKTGKDNSEKGQIWKHISEKKKSENDDFGNEEFVTQTILDRDNLTKKMEIETIWKVSMPAWMSSMKASRNGAVGSYRRPAKSLEQWLCS